jgi:hypothetical protein
VLRARQGPRMRSCAMDPPEGGMIGCSRVEHRLVRTPQFRNSHEAKLLIGALSGPTADPRSA